ncbi:putative membrane protein (partial), partial [Candidatus Ichthyocystis hellenicum]
MGIFSYIFSKVFSEVNESHEYLVETDQEWKEFNSVKLGTSEPPKENTGNPLTEMYKANRRQRRSQDELNSLGDVRFSTASSMLATMSSIVPGWGDFSSITGSGDCTSVIKVLEHQLSKITVTSARIHVSPQHHKSSVIHSAINDIFSQRMISAPPLVANETGIVRNETALKNIEVRINLSQLVMIRERLCPMNVTLEQDCFNRPDVLELFLAQDIAPFVLSEVVCDEVLSSIEVVTAIGSSSRKRYLENCKNPEHNFAFSGAKSASTKNKVRRYRPVNIALVSDGVNTTESTPLPGITVTSAKCFRQYGDLLGNFCRDETHNTESVICKENLPKNLRECVEGSRVGYQLGQLAPGSKVMDLRAVFYQTTRGKSMVRQLSETNVLASINAVLEQSSDDRPSSIYIVAPLEQMTECYFNTPAMARAVQQARREGIKIFGQVPTFGMNMFPLGVREVISIEEALEVETSLGFTTTTEIATTGVSITTEAQTTEPTIASTEGATTVKVTTASTEIATTTADVPTTTESEVETTTAEAPTTTEFIATTEVTAESTKGATTESTTTLEPTIASTEGSTTVKVTTASTEIATTTADVPTTTESIATTKAATTISGITNASTEVETTTAEAPTTTEFIATTEVTAESTKGVATTIEPTIAPTEGATTVKVTTAPTEVATTTADVPTSTESIATTKVATTTLGITSASTEVETTTAEAPTTTEFIATTEVTAESTKGVTTESATIIELTIAPTEGATTVNVTTASTEVATTTADTEVATTTAEVFTSTWTTTTEIATTGAATVTEDIITTISTVETSTFLATPVSVDDGILLMGLLLLFSVITFIIGFVIRSCKRRGSLQFSAEEYLELKGNLILDGVGRDLHLENYDISESEEESSLSFPSPRPLPCRSLSFSAGDNSRIVVLPLRRRL